MIIEEHTNILENVWCEEFNDIKYQENFKQIKKFNFNKLLSFARFDNVKCKNYYYYFIFFSIIFIIMF